MKKIPLTQGKFAVIDSEDFEKISKYNYHVVKGKSNNETFYACRYQIVEGKETTRSLHRDILDCKAGFDIDHINGDGLDNRKSNLREVTRSQNNCNSVSHPNSTSKYKGVCRPTGVNRWRASITVNKSCKYLGLF